LYFFLSSISLTNINYDYDNTLATIYDELQQRYCPIDIYKK
ncbi:unnamed protein product, partial [Rotaria sp. Silwood2]